MAEKLHIQWLLEGAESWNLHREQHPFVPNLADANLHLEFREAGKLSDDGFVPLDGVNLQHANLRSAIFQAPGRHGSTWGFRYRDLTTNPFSPVTRGVSPQFSLRESSLQAGRRAPR